MQLFKGTNQAHLRLPYSVCVSSESSAETAQIIRRLVWDFTARIQDK